MGTEPAVSVDTSANRPDRTTNEAAKWSTSIPVSGFANWFEWSREVDLSLGDLPAQGCAPAPAPATLATPSAPRCVWSTFLTHMAERSATLGPSSNSARWRARLAWTRGTTSWRALRRVAAHARSFQIRTHKGPAALPAITHGF